MTWKKWMCILCIGIILCGCESALPESTGATVSESSLIQIGMSFDTFVIERWQRDRDIFVSTAKELGAEVNVQNANGDVAEQINQLEYFIEKGMDVIVVVPIDAEALTEVVQDAHDHDIEVICYDRLIRNAGTDAYISFDNEAVGTLMGSSMSSQLAVGDQVLMISGPTTDANVEQVNRGFMEEMQKAGITIIDTIYIDEWKAELAYDYVSTNIDQISSDVDGIMCGNDNLASQVIVALAENRLAGEIPVTGQDADLDACQRIVEGTQYMTVYKPVGNLAEQAAILAVQMAQGEEIAYESTINDGTSEVPYIRLSPEAVTVDNMDEIIIESGFHLREDVYINRPDMIEE